MSLIPQFGFFELMLVAVVALIVVGPKDLPKLMRSAGRMVAKARAMAREFSMAFDQMAREAEMEDLRRELDDLKRNNPVADVKRAMDETLAPIDKELRDEANEVRDAVSRPAGAGSDARTDRAPSPKAAPDAPANGAAAPDTAAPGSAASRAAASGAGAKS